MDDKLSYKLIPYRKVYGGYQLNSYKKLNPTGRWKLKYSYYSYENDPTLYIEHKSWIFKYWIHEDSIVLRPSEEEVIFDCKK